MKKSAVSIIVLWSALAPTLAAGLDIQAIQGPSDAPEQFRKFALKGDLLVSDAKFAALIAGSSRPLVNDLNIPLADPFGQIMAFAPAGRGGRVLTLIGAPSLRIAGKSMTTTVSSVKAEGRGIVVRASALSPSGAKFEITTGYRFDFETGRIGIVSEIRNAGPGDAQSVSYGLGANFLQNYNFTPYNAKAFPELNFRVYQRPEHVLAWWNPNPPETSDKPLPGRLGAGRSHRVTYALLAGTDIAGMLDELYKTAGVPADHGLSAGRFDDGRAAAAAVSARPGRGPGPGTRDRRDFLSRFPGQARGNFHSPARGDLYGPGEFFPPHPRTHVPARAE
jgi:hypothetical protein